MKELAEADGAVFLPNPEPVGPVDCVFLCMEPSLGGWASSPDGAKEKVEAGFRNFLSSMEDFLLHFSIREYLCGVGQQYHITDLSKGAMLVKWARIARAERYDRWYGLLIEELDLVTTPGARVIAVGRDVARQLERRGFARLFTTILHYSGQAARARAEGIVGYEDRFEAFCGSVSLDDVLATAAEVMLASSIPTKFRNETLARLAKSQMSPSRTKLIFNYKLAFESMKAVHSE